MVEVRAKLYGERDRGTNKGLDVWWTRRVDKGVVVEIVLIFGDGRAMYTGANI